MTAPVQLFGLGQQGKSPNVTAQERVNLYAEIAFEGDKSRVAYYPTPGCSLFSGVSASPMRGMHASTSFDDLYAVSYGAFYGITPAGAASNLGALTTVSGAVSMADDGTRILIVDGVGGYYWNVDTTTFSTIVDADFPAGATSCAFLAGRMIANDPASTNAGQFRWSDLYADTWPALNFANAESSPDNLVAVFVNGGQLMLMGGASTEWWGVTGDAALPFAPIPGAVAEWGLASPRAVSKFGASSVAWLGRNRLGQVQVVQADGYQVRPISIPDIDYLINNYAAVDDATMYSYMLGGHPMLEISFPTANKSWLYDGRSEAWSQLTTGNLGRHLAQYGVAYRGKMRVSDYASGDIYTLEPDVYTDNGQTIRRSITGRHIFQGDPMSVSEMWIDMEMGVGVATGQGSNPQLMLRTSKDGGHVWSNELWAGFGPQGVYQRRAVFRRLGRARDWLFELSCSDPVKTVFIGAFMGASS
jgi:hypothetical protein